MRANSKAYIIKRCPSLYKLINDKRFTSKMPVMEKTTHSAEYLLNQLGELSFYLTDSAQPEHSEYFDKPLQIINDAMGFHTGILYKISNVIENDLILEVIAVRHQQYERPDLHQGTKICLNIDNPPAVFINEVMAFKNRNVSAINVPGWGCDIVGSIYIPKDFGYGYLLAGDFFGGESGTQSREVRTCEIMCNLLSAVLMKIQFEQLANYDDLTGLLNSRSIREELEKLVHRQKRKKNQVGAVVLADIDFFKKINDQYGHIQGDIVLQEIGRIFKQTMRKHLDIVGRYGGEEFLLIYEDLDAAHVINAVERLRQFIADHLFQQIGEDGKPQPSEYLKVSMSFGIALFTNQIENSTEILSMADQALYLSKNRGRNCATCHNADQ